MPKRLHRFTLPLLVLVPLSSYATNPPLAQVVRVVDGEDLEEDAGTERPPCRYVVLSGTSPAVVVDPECMAWH